MNEDFIQFIWKHQYFNKAKLKTTSGSDVNIINPGFINKDSGPDFSHARISIDNIEWNGQVEIHKTPNDWYAHKHQNNKAYDNVVLHVVWSGDEEVMRPDGTPIPTITLHGLVKPALIDRYRDIVENTKSFPCAPHISKVGQLKIFEVFDKANAERLERKSLEVSVYLRKCKNDWNHTALRLLFANFGFKTNKDAFIRLFETLPYNVIFKTSQNLIQLNALLFGNAGFLDSDLHDEYHKLLKKEYSFISAKYDLKNKMKISEWKFSKMRPANFPSIRIAQLASIIHKFPKFFTFVRSVETYKEIQNSLAIYTSQYWRENYNFGKPANKPMGKFGSTSIDSIIINSMAPLLAAYGYESDDHQYIEKGLIWLQNIKPEENKKTKIWTETGVELKSAFDSQAAIHMTDNFCLKKRCLECSIGMSLINN